MGSDAAGCACCQPGSMGEGAHGTAWHACMHACMCRGLRAGRRCSGAGRGRADAAPQGSVHWFDISAPTGARIQCIFKLHGGPRRPLRECHQCLVCACARAAPLTPSLAHPPTRPPAHAPTQLSERALCTPSPHPPTPHPTPPPPSTHRAISEMTLSMAGSTSCVSASRSISAWLRLLMSSLVQAKWVNSSTWAVGSKGAPARVVLCACWCVCGGGGPWLGVLMPLLETRAQTPPPHTHLCELWVCSKLALEHVLDRLDVVVGRALHRLDLCRVLQREAGGQLVQQSVRSGAGVRVAWVGGRASARPAAGTSQQQHPSSSRPEERAPAPPRCSVAAPRRSPKGRHLWHARQLCQCLQPAALHQYPEPHEPVLAEAGAQARHLGTIPPVGAGQGGVGCEVGGQALLTAGGRREKRRCRCSPRSPSPSLPHSLPPSLAPVQRPHGGELRQLHGGGRSRGAVAHGLQRATAAGSARERRRWRGRRLHAPRAPRIQPGCAQARHPAR